MEIWGRLCSFQRRKVRISRPRGRDPEKMPIAFHGLINGCHLKVKKSRPPGKSEGAVRRIIPRLVAPSRYFLLKGGMGREGTILIPWLDMPAAYALTPDSCARRIRLREKERHMPFHAVYTEFSESAGGFSAGEGARDRFSRRFRAGRRPGRRYRFRPAPGGGHSPAACREWCHNRAPEYDGPPVRRAERRRPGGRGKSRR